MPEPGRVLRDYILGPAHLGFVVPDLEAAVAEACRVYGIPEADVELQPAPGTEAATRFAFFEVGGLQFELIEPVSAAFIHKLLEMPSGGAGINHVAWSVRDIEGALAVLAEAGIRPGHVTPGGIVEFGRRKMVYLDPLTTGGQVIELIEYPADA
jgi:methylmalonyl-CoA/ethylmalonyl-CoA epimerase